jgi:ribosomal protein S18 acetylase RimI-like enzyme
MARRDVDAAVQVWSRLMSEGTAADPRYLQGDIEAIRADMLHWFACFHPFSPAHVAWTGGSLVGWISGQPTRVSLTVSAPKSARIDNLWVDPDFRRRGLGRALVSTWTTEARDAGFERLEVATLARDQRAVAFWRQQGFGDWLVLLSNEP